MWGVGTRRHRAVQSRNSGSLTLARMAVTRSVAVPGQSHGHDGNTFPELTLADIVATSRIAVLPGRAILGVSCVHNCARVWGYFESSGGKGSFLSPLALPVSPPSSPPSAHCPPWYCAVHRAGPPLRRGVAGVGLRRGHGNAFPSGTVSDSSRRVAAAAAGLSTSKTPASSLEG